MTSHKNAGGLAVNWCMFGSNGHVTKPEGGVLENYTTRASDDNIIPNHTIKTIFDPAKTFSYISPHFLLYRRGFHNLDENGNITYGTQTQEVHFAKIRINHYYTKSQEEYIARRLRNSPENVRAMALDNFSSRDFSGTIDTEILSLV